MFSFPLLVKVVDTKYFASMKMVTDFDRYAKPNNLQKKDPPKNKKKQHDRTSTEQTPWYVLVGIFGHKVPQSYIGL